MSSERQGRCFVVMGYGRKTDYQTGRILDLDKTYYNIIKPAVLAAGVECERGDEIRHVGVIDVPMYRELLLADVVVADISTCNPNALYELGVRHALRPHTTVIMAESKLPYPFDISHSVILKYDHLGEDVGYSEVMRMRAKLTELLVEILAKPSDDSPVYRFLNGLKPPELPPLNGGDASATYDSLRHVVEQGEAALAVKQFRRAAELFQAALLIDQHNPYVAQRLALCTYKSKYPTPEAALQRAWEVLCTLSPDTTTDPETLGLSGAVHKRLWELNGQPEDLESAIRFHTKGFLIKDDYYNGINVGFLYVVRASQAPNPDEAVADRIWATRVYRRVVQLCQQRIAAGVTKQEDLFWAWATMAEAQFGMGDTAACEESLRQAKVSGGDPWMWESSQEQIAKLAALLGKSVPGGSSHD